MSITSCTVRESLQALLGRAGAEKYQDIKNAGEDKLIAAGKDPDGNIIGLIQPPLGSPE